LKLRLHHAQIHHERGFCDKLSSASVLAGGAFRIASTAACSVLNKPNDRQSAPNASKPRGPRDKIKPQQPLASMTLVISASQRLDIRLEQV
jgi:hypothetical protein